MSEYTDLFDFTAYDPGLNAFEPDQLAPSPVLDQSGALAAPCESSVGLTEGDTAAQLHTCVDFAPSVVAESSGFEPLGPTRLKHICAVCLAPFQTDSALHQHAKQAVHQAYKCKCGTDFNKRSALERHIKTKDAPKNFACTLCYEKFNRKDKLHDHCRHYHKVTDEGLRALFNKQEARPRAAATRLRRAPVPLAAASSGSNPPTMPAPASVSAGLSAWGSGANAGQRLANLPAGPFLSAETFVPAGPSVPAASPFTSAPVPDKDFADLANEMFGDGTWATNIDDLTF